MAFSKLHWKKAAATIEYMALIVMIIGALIVFGKYIARGLWGKWKQAGDTFGHGRVYDPRAFGTWGDEGGTLDCVYIYDDPSDVASAGAWTHRQCYEQCMVEAEADVVTCRTDCRNDHPEVAMACD